MKLPIGLNLRDKSVEPSWKIIPVTIDPLALTDLFYSLDIDMDTAKKTSIQATTDISAAIADIAEDLSKSGTKIFGMVDEILSMYLDKSLFSSERLQTIYRMFVLDVSEVVAMEVFDMWRVGNDVRIADFLAEHPSLSSQDRRVVNALSYDHSRMVLAEKWFRKKVASLRRELKVKLKVVGGF